jgi:hypothetical protein
MRELKVGGKGMGNSSLEVGVFWVSLYGLFPFGPGHIGKRIFICRLRKECKREDVIVLAGITLFRPTSPLHIELTHNLIQHSPCLNRLNCYEGCGQKSRALRA